MSDAEQQLKSLPRKLLESSSVEELEDHASALGEVLRPREPLAEDHVGFFSENLP